MLDVAILAAINKSLVLLNTRLYVSGQRHIFASFLSHALISNVADFHFLIFSII